MQHIIRELCITNARQLETQLDEAVQVAIDEAVARQRHGVLVTRHDTSNFTVGLSPDVPFGTTQEHDQRVSKGK